MSAETKQVSFGSGASGSRALALNKASKWYPSQEDSEAKKVGSSLHARAIAIGRAAVEMEMEWSGGHTNGFRAVESSGGELWNGIFGLSRLVSRWKSRISNKRRYPPTRIQKHGLLRTGQIFRHTRSISTAPAHCQRRSQTISRFMY